MPMYVIKCGAMYLHSLEERGKPVLRFLEQKQGALIYTKDNANIVVGAMQEKGALRIFKAKIKDKYVKDKPEPKIKLLSKMQKKGAKRRLKKNV
jgi:hypothetical protein